MSSEKSAGQNLYIADDILIGQHKVKDRKMIDEEKINNNETIDGISNACMNDSSISAISLQSLDDDDFRNLLNIAAKPQYGSLQRTRKKLQITTEYSSRRLSDAGENTGLSAEADNLLAQFRREAELNQRNADIERGEKQRTVTAFIREAAVTSRTREFLEKYSEQPESRESHLPSKHTKCGTNNTNNDHHTKDFLRIRLNSDGSSKIAVEQKFIHTRTSNDIMNNNDNYTSGDISRATQTIDKPSSITMNFDELNSTPSIENGCMNMNKIAYIDEDERTSDSCRSSNMHIGENENGHINAADFKNIYTQGNSVQEIRALNDSEDDEVMVNIISKVSKDHESDSITEANMADDKIQKNTEASSAVAAQGKHDDNPFTYSAGQLRLHGNRVGTYDMQKSRTLGVKRDVLTADVNLIPANTSNSLLARDLVPAQFDGRETYARGLLDPTEDTRLNPQQANLDNNEMANLKNQPDKCAIAKRRKENKKAKEAKNSYVVESKDGYMGNLSPEEILKRIEGDSKGKAKGNQKNGTNGSKDHSSIVANGSKNSGGRKKGDKKDKAARRSLINDREVIELSVKMETLNTEKAKTVVMAETTSDSKHESLMTGMRISKTQIITSSPRSDEIDEARSGVTAAKVTTDEVVDDEEQYLSADEGANSNFSDDIKTELQYHTDEQSGASGSRDFISDGANYRADDEEINPLPLTSEESEFIQVTGRSKRRTGAALIQHQQQLMASGMDRKNVYFNSNIDRGARSNIRRGADRLRRSSIQLPADSRRNQPSSCGNTSPSSVDYESSGGKGQTIGASGNIQPQQQRQQQQHLKFATSTSISKKAKYGLPSSLQTSRTASPDRRGSQPLTSKYSTTTESSGSSPAVAHLSEDLSAMKRKVLDHQIGTVTIAATKAPAQRSWADIARQRLYDNAEIRPNEATAHDYPRTSVKEEHSVSAASSISGHVNSAKKVEQSEQKRTTSMEAISSDLAVKDYSFFFDPNEPAGIVLKESESNSSKTLPKKANEDSISLKSRCSGMVLNLDGGRQIVLPENDLITTGPASIVDIRQRPEIIIVNEMWKNFTENPAAVMTYKEYQRQKQGSDQEDCASKKKNRERTKGAKREKENRNE